MMAGNDLRMLVEAILDYLKRIETSGREQWP